MRPDDPRNEFDRRAALRALGLVGVPLALGLTSAACTSTTPAVEMDPPIEPGGKLLVERYLGAPGRLREAWFQAFQLGRPLLVFVPPDGEDGTLRLDRGAQLLDYGKAASADALADLALVEIACARRAEVEKHLREFVTGLPAEPFAVLCETDGSSVRWIEGAPPLDEASEPAGRARDAWLQARIRQLIAPDAATLRRRAEQALCSVTAEERASFGPIDDDTRPTPTHAQRLPAWVLVRAEQVTDERAAWRELVADAGATRHGMGSRLHRAQITSPCGAAPEGSSSSEHFVDCGMAVIPSLTRSFLRYYAH